MRLKRVAIVGAASAGAIVATGRALVSRWADNPDPLGGRAPTFPSGTIRVVDTDDGARIHTETTGEGPTVVLVHGITEDRHHWGPIAQRLVAAGCEVVGVDQRGHGDSTVGSEGFSGPRLGADLDAVFTRLDLRDAVLVGHSMGGIAALSNLTSGSRVVSDRLAGLVLVATTARAHPATLQGFKILPRHFGRRHRVMIGLSGFGRSPSLNMIDCTMEAFNETPREVLLAAIEGLADYDVLGSLGSVTTRTWVLCGTRDLVTPLRENRLIAARIPGAQMIELKAAGHMITWERVDDIVAAIRTALADH